MPNARRISISHDTERARIESARRVRIGYEARWWRQGYRGGMGALLQGPFGEMFRREIESRFDGGSFPQYDTRGKGSGYPLRWNMLGALADLTQHPMHRVRDLYSLLYRRPVQFSGDAVSSPAFQWLRDRCGFDAAMQRKQALEIMGSVWVRATLEPRAPGSFYPPGLTVVYPEDVILISHPTDPTRAIVAIEFDRAHANGEPLGGAVIVTDITDPGVPIWGRWASINAYLANEGTNGAEWSLSGPDYPWWSQGEPILPGEVYTWDDAPERLLPIAERRLQEALDLMIERTWIRYVGHSGSFQQAVVLSDQAIENTDQNALDPNVVANYTGPGSKDLKIIPDSTQAAERLWKMHGERFAEVVNQYDTHAAVKRSEGAKSGLALTLEMSGLYQLRQHLATKNSKRDTQVMRALIASWNYLIRSGQIAVSLDGDSVRWNPSAMPTPDARLLIPDGPIKITYPHYWSADEKRQVIDEMKSAIADGRESPRALYIIEHDLDDDRPDGPNWQAADEAIRGNLADSMAYASIGYGVSWEARHAAALNSPRAEDLVDPATFTAPRDVSAEAASGLALFNRFNKPGVAARDRRGSPQAARMARELKIGAALDRGDLIDIATFAANAEAVGNGQPGWADDSDPSAQWIDYRCYGGAPGVSWANAELDALDGVPGQNAESLEEQV